MAGENSKATKKSSASASAAASDKREQSTIQFPYGDLADAIAFAQAVHEVGGQSCEVEQVAAYLKQTPTSGAFRLRLSYPRVFGLTENDRGEVSLTELGKRVVDPQQNEAAKVDAFLAVPLYRALYDKYKGYTLPPSTALEREMAALGVSTKQTDKARQVFDRSAIQAGFFWAGKDRLVMPVLAKDRPESRPLDKGTPGSDSRRDDRSKGGGLVGENENLDPLIAALIRKLPPSGHEWTLEGRIRWLNMIEMAFQEAYGPTDRPIQIGST